MAKIYVVLSQNSRYEVMDYYSLQLLEEFRKLGHQVRAVQTEDFLTIAADDPPDWFFSFNGVPQHPSGISLPDLVKKPYLSLLLDWGYRYLNALSSPYVLLGCNDYLSTRFVDNQAKGKGFFLPAAGDGTIEAGTGERPYDVVLFSTFIDYEERMKRWESQPKAVQEIMHASVERTFSNENQSFVEAFQASLEEGVKKGFSHTLKLEQIVGALSELEMVVRGKERADLVLAVERELHIFDGSLTKQGWKEFLRDKKNNCIFHPPVPFPEMVEILKKSKIVLNSSTHLRHGSHEKVFYALLCGCLPITNKGLWMESQLLADQECLYFSHKNLPAINDQISKYLNDKSLREQLVEAGRAKTAEQHTWKNRAVELSKLLQLQ